MPIGWYIFFKSIIYALYKQKFILQVFLCTITSLANQECGLTLRHGTQDSSIWFNIAGLKLALAKKVATSRLYAASTI